MRFITAIFLFLFILIMTSCTGVDERDINLLSRHNNLCKMEFELAKQAKAFKNAKGEEDLVYIRAAEERYKAATAFFKEVQKKDKEEENDKD